MFRTQIYLTEKERTTLKLLTKQTGKSQSQLIRDAIDRLIELLDHQNRRYLLRQARGMWRGRKDLPDFEELRREFDRFPPKDE
ncbi:MAG: ribbon-helix-helix protein, CopG family [Candidatus Neomarinimicrobiota bacterium]